MSLTLCTQELLGDAFAASIEKLPPGTEMTECGKAGVPMTYRSVPRERRTGRGHFDQNAAVGQRHLVPAGDGRLARLCIAGGVPMNRGGRGVSAGRVGTMFSVPASPASPEPA